MPVAVCTVVSGGGWTPFGASFPADLNDGDNGTYEYTPGNTAGSENLSYDYTQVPNGATISTVSVAGLWGAGSSSATVSVTCFLGANNSPLGTLGDVTSYNLSCGATKPGGGAWTKADIQNMFITFLSLATGNGNAIKHRSSALSVTYIASVPAALPMLLF